MRLAIDFDELREKLAYQPISLGLVALIASAALALAYGATREHIAAAEQRDLQASLAQVLPADFADNDLLADVRELINTKGDPVTVHIAKKAGVASGVVFKVAERGYAGDIVVLMAVDAQGRVLGARVLKHSETPGLGDKIDLAKHPWIRSFEGRSLGDPAAGQWSVRKDGGVFDAFAGATITPRAVVKAVKGGLEFFAANRAEMLDEGRP